MGWGAGSGAIGPYSLGGCAVDITCSINGYHPFTLGVPFTITLHGFADAFPPFGGGSFGVNASLELFESFDFGNGAFGPGPPVQIFLVGTPEPSSALLVVTGLATALFASIRRRTKRVVQVTK